MKKLFPLLWLLIFLNACQPAGETFENAVCIQHVNTIDAANGLQADRTVVIQGNRILKNVPAAELDLSPDNEIIDGSGKYLIPGLWDAHVHFAYIEELAPSMFDLFLLYGVTSVRDTGGKIDFMRKWKEASLANPSTAPRLMIAGPLLDGMPNVYDGSSPGRPPLSVGLGSVEAALNKVNELDSIGVDLLKAYEMLTPEQFVAIMGRAKELGLKVTGHVPLSMDVITASNAGLNSMEHLRNVEMSMAAETEELLNRRRTLLKLGQSLQGGVLRTRIHNAQRMDCIANIDPGNKKAVIEALARNETWQIPTLSLVHSFSEKYYTLPDWLESYAYLPESVEQDWRRQVELMAEGKTDPDSRVYADWMSRTTGEMHAGGVGFMTGTDTPIGLQTPGLSLHKELELFVKSGFTPLEALEAATLQPARYFNLEDELGTIQEGMIADLLLLGANPLEDITNTTKIEAVIKAGNMMGAEEREAMKARLLEK